MPVSVRQAAQDKQHFFIGGFTTWEGEFVPHCIWGRMSLSGVQRQIPGKKTGGHCPQKMMIFC